MEDLILAVREELKQTSALGDFGAAAIHREMVEGGHAPVPCVRTIGYVLERRGALDGRRKFLRPAPPRGWYLPDVARGEAELDSFDVVEGLVIRGGTHVEVLNGTSLHGGLVTCRPMASVTAKSVVEALVEHWRECGLPDYAQFDNDTRFQGPHQHPDAVGRVARLCLSLGVTPVFVPPRETGFQAMVENLNCRWQGKVWARFQHASLASLQGCTERYVAASRCRAAARIDSAPTRRSFPKRWRLNLDAPPRGGMIYLRRTSENGTASLLGRTFEVAPSWAHRLVRAVVDLGEETIRFYALRRREPGQQPLLGGVPYSLPKRPFKE
jgi:hypothetical protein